MTKSLKINGYLKPLDTPQVMGIINYNDDSFYEGSRVKDRDAFIKRLEQLISEGVDIIDVGVQSTRPGAKMLPEEKEAEELSMAVSLVQSVTDLPISIDTFRALPAKEGFEAGAAILNDISGWQIDEALFDVIATYKRPYILMHSKGTPATMQQMTDYENLVLDVAAYFKEKVERLKAAGIKDIVLDLGFGFAKTLEQNYELLKNLNRFESFNLPMLVGVSRKSMIYKLLETTPEESLMGTQVLNAFAVQNGADFLRVHDVKSTVETLKLCAQLR